MIPYYRIEIEGTDKTRAFQGRVMSISVTDQDGIRSDSCELTLRDKGDLEIPEMNTKINIYLGVIGRGLTQMGSFLLSEPDLGPGVMKLKGRAAPTGRDFSKPRERSWSDKSYGEIIKEIAGDHKLKPAIESVFFEDQQKHVSQTESDMSFLTRLGMLKDATFKIQNGYLVFASNGKEASVFGKSLPVTEISNPSTWSYKGASSNEYTGVKAYYKNPNEKGKRLETLVGSSSNPTEMIQTWDNLAQATDKAKSRLKELQKTNFTLSLSKSSDERFNSTELASGQTCIVKGVRKNVDGKWKARKVTHKFSKESLSVTAEFEPL